MEKATGLQSSNLPSRPSGQYQVLHQEQQAWHSPTLPPQVIEQYSLIVPDAGERFFRYMEAEQTNRHALQRQAIGQVGAVQRYTFRLSLIGMLGSFVVVALGHAEGLAATFVALLPLVQSVWQRRKQDRLEKQAPQPSTAED
jgi:uncharacterized membrane protein